MEFSQVVLNTKKQYINAINTEKLLLKRIVEKHIKEEYGLKPLNREWEPGGGSTLFQITTSTRKILLKVMNLEILIESKLESEKSFIEVPSIRNEFIFINEINKKLGPEHVPHVIFYEESENYGFLAVEWLEPFEEVIHLLNISEIIQTYNKIYDFIIGLFNLDILYTDIHEKNIRFRNRIPVIIDYGETRYLKQDLLFKDSLAYRGRNRYGSLGKMPVFKKEDIKGRTCLQRLKEVFNGYLLDKLSDHLQKCKFNDTCPFNLDVYQEPDERIYQSIKIRGLTIKGHRPLDDEREKLVKQIVRIFSLKYHRLIYMDVGCNIGSFCFNIAKLKKKIKIIGIDAFEDYLVFADALKFILDVENLSFYKLICGKENIYEKIKELRENHNSKILLSMMSIYHHIRNKEKWIADLKKIQPTVLIIEFATQERYYPERKHWHTEMQYIRSCLNYDYVIPLCTSKDYGRPIVAFTNGWVYFLMILLVKTFLAFKTRKIKQYVSLSFPIHFPLPPAKKQTQYTDSAKKIKRAIAWIKFNRIPNSGIPISSVNPIPYPEVTGYMIPTLYQWGEKKLAKEITFWLMKQQNKDGSFSAPDGSSYAFDTGQVIRGFLSILDDLPEIEKPLKLACQWIMRHVESDGRLITPSTMMWGDIADDRIHLYVLPPLIDAGRKLNEYQYINTAYRILKYYKQRKDLVLFNTLSHFHAYVIEALCDIGETVLAKSGMKDVILLQREDGSVPAYKNRSWICSTGLAQYAIIWYKLGMKEYGDKAVKYLEGIQNTTGGFNGSHGKGANYFPKEEISWAVKFFLDAYYWKIKTAFNVEADLFSDTIHESDGRVQEILSFFEDLNGKRIIDVGCGKGRFLRILMEKFPNCRPYGLDISKKMLDYCPEGIETVCGTLLDIKYPNDFFDCIYCVEAMEHSVLPENAIEEMARILKPNGKIIIIDKNFAKSGELDLEPWEQWFSQKKIIKLLAQNKIKACYKFVSHGDLLKPDGLFIAWEGIKSP